MSISDRLRIIACIDDHPQLNPVTVRFTRAGRAKVQTKGGATVTICVDKDTKKVHIRA